jgi:hypothetical protein
MSPTYLWFGSAAVKSRLSRSGTLWPAGSGTGRADPSAQPHAGDAVLLHHPGDALVADPVLLCGAVVELGGDPRRPVGLVLLVHDPRSAERGRRRPRRVQPAQERPVPRRSRTIGRSRWSCTAASPRRRLGGRQRTGSGSPVRLPGEILRRRPQDLPFCGELDLLSFQLPNPGLEPGELGCLRLAPVAPARCGRRVGRRRRRGRRDCRGPGAQGSHPLGQRPPGDAEIAAMPFNVAPSVDSYRSTACRRNSSV